MAGDKTYITDGQGKLHRATRVHAVTPTDIVWSSNPNDYTVQVKIDGKWHRAILTYDVSGASYFDNVNIDKALVVGADGKNHTALIVSSEAAVTLSSIKTDEHALVNGTTTGETAVCTYTEAWGNIEWEDNVNVYKVIVTGSDGKKHTALLTTGANGGVQAIVMGVSPLVLPDAIEGDILSLIAFGGTERNVPQEYTQLDYIESTGTQYINTGIAPNNGLTLKVVFAFTGSTSSSRRVFGKILGSATAALNYREVGARFYWFVSISNSGITTDSQKHTVEFRSDKKVYRDNVEIGTKGSFGTGEEYPMYLFAELSDGGAVNYGQVKIYEWEVYNQGVLIQKFVPAKNSNNVVGMYDTVSGQFFTNAGTGDFAAGGEAVPTPDAPMDIVCNNGVLKVNSQGQIYTDGTVETIAIKDDQNATVSTATCEDLLSIGTYTDEQEVISGSVTRKVGVKVLDGTENWILSGGTGVWANFQSITGVTFGTTSAICSHSAYAGADVSVANMNQNEFSLFANGNIAFKNANTTSTSDWTTFLAQQYAAGTPVIVVYPLATPTTESVTGQPMETAEGDCTAEITQASLNNLELQVEYIKA